MAKKGVMLLNLGSPDSTEVTDVRAYLKEFLMDERVLDSSEWLRKFIVNVFILPTRPKQSAEAYEEIWTDDGSPLIVTSEKFAELVREKVSIPVYVGMRYGNPSTVSAVQKAKDDGVEELLIFPQYPHYAMSSYESALVCATEAIADIAPEMSYTVVNPYYNDPAYIDCLIDQSKSYLDKGYDHLLFSFHGIPERHLRKSDPSHAHCLSRADCCECDHPAHATCYRHQCLETVRHFVERANIPENKFTVSFQSRLGRDPWLRPYTDQTLEGLPEKGVKNLLVICPAFVTDCLETLEEIAMEGRDSFIESGGEKYEQIPCLNLNEKWVRYAVDQIEDFVSAPARLEALV